jgi:uncharacterized Tic20 family protein
MGSVSEAIVTFFVCLAGFVLFVFLIFLIIGALALWSQKRDEKRWSKSAAREKQHRAEMDLLKEQLGMQDRKETK